MKVQVKEAGTWRRTVEVEVPGDTVEQRFDDAYRNYGKSLRLPGFRKGKVPLSMVKKRFGKAIQGEVLQEVIQEFYREASKTEGLHPVSQASIEEMDYVQGQPLRFKATVDVKPEIKPENYRGLEVTRSVMRVKDEHVEEQVAQIREQGATEQVVERPVALGDVLVADVQELDESGLPLIGRNQSDQSIRIGRPGATDHDLDNQLVGISAGEQRRITLTRTPDHDDPGEAEREVRFLVTAKEVREHNLPELDDEFARDAGNFESLEDLKNRIREDLKARFDYIARRQVEENIVDALIRGNDFELPESMIENHLDTVVESYKQEHAGHDHPIDEDAVRQENRPHAIRSLKRFLLLEAIARQEGLEVTEAEMNEHLQALSERHNVEVPRLRQIFGRSGQLERIESELFEEKTLRFLVEHAKIEEVEETSEPREA